MTGDAGVAGLAPLFDEAAGERAKRNAELAGVRVDSQTADAHHPVWSAVSTRQD